MALTTRTSLFFSSLIGTATRTQTRLSSFPLFVTSSTQVCTLGNRKHPFLFVNPTPIVCLDNQGQLKLTSRPLLSVCPELYPEARLFWLAFNISEVVLCSSVKYAVVFSRPATWNSTLDNRWLIEHRSYHHRLSFQLFTVNPIWHRRTYKIPWDCCTESSSHQIIREHGLFCIPFEDLWRAS